MCVCDECGKGGCANAGVRRAKLLRSLRDRLPSAHAMHQHAAWLQPLSGDTALSNFDRKRKKAQTGKPRRHRLFTEAIRTLAIVAVSVMIFFFFFFFGAIFQKKRKIILKKAESKKKKAEFR